MNKTALLKSAIDDIGNLSKSLNAFYEALISDEPDFEEVGADQTVEETPAKKVTLEEVRTVLAEKSRMGMTEGVRNLIGEYGASKLSDIDPKHYAEILERAETIGDPEKASDFLGRGGAVK